MTTFSDLKDDTIDVLTVDPAVGNKWYVDSGSGTGGDGGGYGTTPATPFVTLDYAVGAATASNGDIIYLMPGHAETKAAASNLWAIDKAGLTIVGLGRGAERPTFTMSDVGAVCTITAASTWLENVLFVSAIDSVVAPLTVSAADCTIKDVEFRDTTDVEFVRGLITTATADRITIDGLYYNGYTGGNACTTGLALVGVNGGVVKNCRFSGLFSTACIDMLTTLSNNIVIENCYFYNATAAVTQDVAMNIAACVYQVKNCYDGVAGYEIAGSQTNGVQWAGNKPLMSSKLSGTITVASQAMFNYIGMIRVHGLYGYVATAMQNATVNISFAAQGSADAAALAVSAATDFDNDVVNTAWACTGDFNQVLLETADVSTIELAQTAVSVAPWLMYSPAITGVVNLVGGHVNSGKLQAYLLWEPASPGAYVKAA
jgi:hypothetical protein